MGWGTEPHEGWADERLADGRWTGGTRRGGEGDAVLVQAACGCGWRSDREHPVPPRPANLPCDERGVSYGPEYDGWIAELEAAEDACWQDWNAEHYQPLLGYEPHTQLILGRGEGGQRHFLDGHPVHAGAALEVLMANGTWLRVRYEWSFADGTLPTAAAALGVPDAAQNFQEPSIVEFALPADAILRWPDR